MHTRRRRLSLETSHCKKSDPINDLRERTTGEKWAQAVTKRSQPQNKAQRGKTVKAHRHCARVVRSGRFQRMACWRQTEQQSVSRPLSRFEEAQPHPSETTPWPVMPHHRSRRTWNGVRTCRWSTALTRRGVSVGARFCHIARRKQARLSPMQVADTTRTEPFPQERAEIAPPPDCDLEHPGRASDHMFVDGLLNHSVMQPDMSLSGS